MPNDVEQKTTEIYKRYYIMVGKNWTTFQGENDEILAIIRDRPI